MMPVWGWFFIAALVLVAIAGLIVALSAGRRRRTDRLRQQFGPEYDRAVAQTGEQQAAEKELVARERKRKKLDIRPLSRDALQAYSQRWRQVQTAFVDDPSTALDEADRLVSEVMRERGYPVVDFDQRAADVSVDHPAVVENYRSAHAIHLSGLNGDAATEQQRQAFVHYRALFDELLDQHKNIDRPQDTDSAQEASA
jgi:hypothetical protein